MPTIYDDNNDIIENPDLTKGMVLKEQRIKPNATPIDNVHKFAWYDDDYEEIFRYHEYTPEELQTLAEQEAANTKAKAREAFLDSAPGIQEEIDAAICELYEQNLAMQEEMDETICDLYEMILGGE